MPIDEIFDIESTDSQKIADEKYHDFLMRVAFAPSEEQIQLAIVRTETFRDKLEKTKEAYWLLYEDVQCDVEILSDVIKSQKQLLDYNGHYNAFLMGQISEDEFVEISGEFAYHPREIGVDELADKLNRFFKYIGFEFLPSELGDIFRCDPKSIEAALVAVQHMKEIGQD